MPNSFKIDASAISNASEQNVLLQIALYTALSKLSQSLVASYEAVTLEAITVTTKDNITTLGLKDALEQAATKTLSGAAARALVDRLTIKSE